MKQTDVQQFIVDLDGGVFAEKLGLALSQVAAGVVDTEKEGTVQVEMKIKPAGGHQVQVEHKLKFKEPTQRGSKSRDDMTKTPMHVGGGGVLSFFPETQTKMQFSEEPSTAK